MPGVMCNHCRQEVAAPTEGDGICACGVPLQEAIEVTGFRPHDPANGPLVPVELADEPNKVIRPASEVTPIIRLQAPDTKSAQCQGCTRGAVVELTVGYSQRHANGSTWSHTTGLKLCQDCILVLGLKIDRWTRDT